MDMDINTDPDYGRTKNPDMVLGSSPDPDVTVASGGLAGHSDWHGPRPQPAFRWWPRSQPSVQSLVVTRATDLMYPQLLRGFVSRLVFGSSPGREMTLDSGGAQVILISLFLTPAPLQICHSP